jgi:DNA polymerase III subunit epsilon
MMYCILDLETTGINQFYDQPIEIGAVLVDETLQKIDRFHSYIHIPETLKFSTSAKKTHGLDESFLSNKPSQATVLRNFFDKFGYDFRFVTWNMSFDVGFFRRICYENNFQIEFDRLNYRHLDLQSMFFYYCEKKGYSNLKSLDDACHHFGISRSNFHSALEDAEITYKLFRKLMIEK